MTTTTAAATETVFVKIGWTRSDMANGYSSFSGYQPGASQHEESFFLSVPAGTTAEEIAESAFAATNAPFLTEGSIAARILTKIQQADYHGQQAHYSLSVGDTVTVGETMLACERFGFKEVS